MAQHWKKWLAVTLAAQLALSGAAKATDLSIRAIAAHELRLASIGYRIASANSTTCVDPRPLSGLVAHDLTQYPLGARASVSRVFSLQGGIGVLGVVPGSGAFAAGFQIDDEIVGVGGVSVQNPSAWTERVSSYRRMDAFFEQLSKSLEVGPQRVLIRRRGRLMELRLIARAGCGGAVKFADSRSVNAWADGKHVVLNRAIVQMTSSDDELAFIIAHEMAHNILGHLGPPKDGSRALFGRIFEAGKPRNSESQADFAAVSLMTKAGYSPEAGISFLKSASQRIWWAGLSLGHPGFGARMRTVAEAIRQGDLARISAYRTAMLGGHGSSPVPNL